MKKISWVFALLAMITMVFAGCTDAAMNEDTVLVLAGNQYGDGYQIQLSGAAFPGGGSSAKVKDGEKWTLLLQFTVSREIPGGLEFCFVDSADSVGYWNQLGSIEFDTTLLPGVEYTAVDTFEVDILGSPKAAQAKGKVTKPTLAIQSTNADSQQGSHTKPNIVITASKFKLYLNEEE
jgi:hypothetical protein